MKNKMKKFVSALATGVMLASTVAVPVNATDEVASVQMQSILDELDAGTLTIEQAEEMLSVGQVLSESFCYPPYDKYVTNKVSSSPHYLAAIPIKGSSFNGNFTVSLYLNTNILESMPTASDFILYSSYSENASITSVKNSNFSNGCKKVDVSVGINQTCTADYALFKYQLFPSNVIDSERDFHNYTSSSSVVPTSDIFSNKDNIVFKKCVYSMGDVDRDGDVDEQDRQCMSNFIVGRGSREPGRSDEEDYYDRIAFRLAGDFDGNGRVDFSDVVAVSKILQ